jgi:hypothetical protein
MNVVNPHQGPYFIKIVDINRNNDLNDCKVRRQPLFSSHSVDVSGLGADADAVDAVKDLFARLSIMCRCYKTFFVNDIRGE